MSRQETSAIIAQAHALQESILPGQCHGFDNPAVRALRDAARNMIDAALYRDLDAAMRAAAKAECEANGEEYAYDGAPYSLQSRSFGSRDRLAPKRYTKQSDWRDYAGYLCTTERMANWVAAWIARYLDPRDGDGNPAPGRVHKITSDGKSDAWLAVTASYKIGD